MNIRTFGAVAALVALASCSADDGNKVAGGPPAAAPAGSAMSVVPGSEEDLKANVGDRVFFALDRSNIKGDQAPTLDRQAGWLGKYGQVSVQISGNCDDRGTEEYNIALGQRRANAARDYLVAKGVAGARMATISYGKDRPVALGDNEAAWAQNRNAITEVK